MSPRTVGVIACRVLTCTRQCFSSSSREISSRPKSERSAKGRLAVPVFDSCLPGSVKFRVPVLPGKSWNCACIFSRTWKVLKMSLVLESPVNLMQDPGKSWNLLASDADGWLSDSDTNAKICTSCENNCKECFSTVSLLFLHNTWQWWTYTPVWVLLSYYG